MKKSMCAAILAVLTLPVFGFAAEANDEQRPIRALLVTGGCCHDYERQKQIITQGVSARADVVWTVAHQGGKATDAKIPLYEDPDWAEGFDIVVHNECFAGVGDVEWVEQILKPHKEGVPAVLIHCAMHCYRTGDDRWFEFCGVQSPGHGPHYAYTAENRAPDHPIMQDFGDAWTTPQGELYHTLKLWPTAKPLAHARRKSDGEPQICIWTNEYEDTRVFGTTIGHHNETMVEPTYLDMLARGILWAVERDPASVRKTNAETNEKIKAIATAPVAEKNASAPELKCCGEGNLALSKETKASSEETGKNNFARRAVDGNLHTRWCASGASSGEWWQIDLGRLEHVRSLRIHWEKDNTAYQYKVEASADGDAWRTIVDQSRNSEKEQIAPHQVDAADTRYLRVTFLGASTGVWGSFWEFEAYGGDLPELPESAKAGPAQVPATIADVQAPEEFDVALFGAPPEVNYPVCLTAAPTGEVFVGVDEQGSLGKEQGRGKVLRCVDTTGDGRADQVNVFAKMDHPRGLIYDDGSLWVLHPPRLSVYHDDDRDGEADRHETLITGISSDQVEKRGADHTTNGIRMGIDGWIYIAVGDFGFTKAVGADGKTLSRRGGGVVRVRPDGTDMEIFAWGLRNILDVCIDPRLNMFTRDNTNDGGGWDVRLSHILQSARYGYPSLYMNFSEEIMPPLADYGGGSGCGGMYLHDLRWPEPYADALYTCDWGRSEVYRHNLPNVGPTFEAHQEVFLKIPRPTDIDVDGSGRMYVSSWKGGKFNYDGPNVGFVARLTPRGFTPKPFPRLVEASDAELAEYLAAPSAVYRLHSQRELLRRGDSSERRQMLIGLADDADTPLYGRIAAIFTLKQLAGAASHDALLKLIDDDSTREFALRALADRKDELEDVPLAPFIKALEDSDPRVRAQALICLGRLGRQEAADAILPLTRRSDGSHLPSGDPLHNQPDPGHVIPHLAVRALVSIDAVEACLEGLDGPYASGALWALRYMHSEPAVEGLIDRLGHTRDQAQRRRLFTALIRLYHQEAEYEEGWWGTRPDTTGPYYDRQEWAMSPRIAEVLRVAVDDAPAETAQHIREQLARHQAPIEGLPTESEGSSSSADQQQPISLPEYDEDDPQIIANLPPQEASERAISTAGDPAKGEALFRRQACIACHTYADGQTPKGPHLVDIGKRYKRAELVESVLKPSEKIAQGFDTYTFLTSDGKVVTGFVVSESADSVRIRRDDGVALELPQDAVEARKKQEVSMMPKGVVNNLTPEQLADLLAYLESLE